LKSGQTPCPSARTCGEKVGHRNLHTTIVLSANPLLSQTQSSVHSQLFCIFRIRGVLREPLVPLSEKVKILHFTICAGQIPKHVSSGYINSTTGRPGSKESCSCIAFMYRVHVSRSCIAFMYRVHVSRPFSLSSSTQGYSDDPIIRREQHDRRNARRREKYASDLQYQAKRKLMESERIRARRAKPNEQRDFQSTRRRNFQIFVKNRMRRGESLIWKTHVAEVSEEAVLRYCVGCKRTHHTGSTLWWRRKEDGEYDVCIVYEQARCCVVMNLTS